MRCSHDPVTLFDLPPKGNERAAILYFLTPSARKHWVICRHCAATGYWGGYGIKRRVRWGYGDTSLLKTAEHHNRLMRGETVVRESI